MLLSFAAGDCATWRLFCKKLIAAIVIYFGVNARKRKHHYRKSNVMKVLLLIRASQDLEWRVTLRRPRLEPTHARGSFDWSLSRNWSICRSPNHNLCGFEISLLDCVLHSILNRILFHCNECTVRTHSSSECWLMETCVWMSEWMNENRK